MNRIGILITGVLLLAAPVVAQEQSPGPSTSTLPRERIQVFRSSGDENAVYMTQPYLWNRSPAWVTT